MSYTPRTEEPFTLASLAPKRRRRRRALFAWAAIASALGAASVVAFVALHDAAPSPATRATTAAPAAAAPKPETSSNAVKRPYVVTGSVTLWTHLKETATDCTGDDRFNDMREGADILIRGASGNVLAGGKLGRGQVDGLSCVFLFEIRNVPRGEGVYRFDVGDHAGREDHTEADVGGGVVNLTFGITAQ